jgi:hypothetical protein
MLKDFATAVMKCEVSDSWVDWFLHCHANKLTTKWTTGIDCEHPLANSQCKYELTSIYCTPRCGNTVLTSATWTI